jgi:hypothetical protein
MSKIYKDISECGNSCEELKKYDIDISKDLLRTFPKVPQFASNSTCPMVSDMSENQQRLSRVLSAFAYYDHGIGYMQGMNFIMASIMYHCNEEVAFWVFVQLMQQDVRSVYEPPNMPGLAHHVKTLEAIIHHELPKLNFHILENLNLATHQIYLHDWIICLFTSIMPINRNLEFII